MPRYRRKTSPKNRLKRSRRSSKQKSLFPRRIKLVDSFILFALGFILLLFPHVFSRWNYWDAKLDRATNQVQTVDFGPIRIDERLLGKKKPLFTPPARILIPNLSLDLEIVESKVVNGYWEVPEMTAAHGFGSASPGEKGNIVVFAHARAGLFLPLRQIKSQNSIYLLTQNKWYAYQVAEIKEVKATDTTVIAPTEGETLTLFTCSGFLDSKRLIVTAKPLAIL